jgi:hypothetical protein
MNGHCSLLVVLARDKNCLLADLSFCILSVHIFDWKLLARKLEWSGLAGRPERRPTLLL